MHMVMLRRATFEVSVLHLHTTITTLILYDSSCLLPCLTNFIHAFEILTLFPVLKKFHTYSSTGIPTEKEPNHML
jgi:hypothetical protein